MTCKIHTCDRPKYCKGYCAPHYGRLRKGRLEPHKPIEGRGTERPFLSSHGYMTVRVRQDSKLYAGQKITEHRLVMARHLGRELTNNETVHHKNGVKTDNRIENLELWLGNHSAGSRIEDRLEDAISMVEEYRDYLTDEQISRLRGDDQ